MKRILAICLATILVFSLFPAPAMADTSDIRVILDGVELEFDVPPMIINDRTMVPMRAIFETLGMEVEWDVSARNLFPANRYNADAITVIASKRVYGARSGTRYVAFQIGNRYMTVTTIWDLGGHRQSLSTIDVIESRLPQIIDNRTFVPLRAISQALDADVDWDEYTRTVTITTHEQINDYRLEGVWRLVRVSENVEWNPGVEIEQFEYMFLPDGTGVWSISGDNFDFSWNFTWETENNPWRNLLTAFDENGYTILSSFYYIYGNTLTFLNDLVLMESDFYQAFERID